MIITNKRRFLHKTLTINTIKVEKKTKKTKLNPRPMIEKLPKEKL